MMPLPHRSLASLSLICACGLWLAGCAGGGAPFSQGSTDVVFSKQGMSVQQVEAALTIGQSTKAEVLVALGPATTIRFDSGHEVWVYRGKPLRAPATAAEFVILFAPSGTVQKTRTRPAYDGLTR